MASTLIAAAEAVSSSLLPESVSKTIAPGKETSQSSTTSADGQPGPEAPSRQADPSAEPTDGTSVGQELPSEEVLHKCADMVVQDVKGESRPFKSLYAYEGIAKKQLIIFIRHFFCGICQEYIRTLSSAITPDLLLSLPTPTFITIVGCGTPELIDMYAKTTGCPFPIYTDPTRKLYEALGMIRTFEVGPKKPDYVQTSMMTTVVSGVMQSLRNGFWRGGDFKQVGGEFFFEDGKLVWCHRMQTTRDHTEVPVVQRLLGLDDAKPPMRKRWSTPIKEFGRRSSSWGSKRSSSQDREKQNEKGKIDEGDEERDSISVVTDGEKSKLSGKGPT